MKYVNRRSEDLILMSIKKNDGTLHVSGRNLDEIIGH